MFFYEEITTLRDQLRTIVDKYDSLARDEAAFLRQQAEEQRSRSTSLDTKERLRAFISRQDQLYRQNNDSVTLSNPPTTGSMTLKKSSGGPSESQHQFGSKAEFDIEIDLKNSI